MDSIDVAKPALRLAQRVVAGQALSHEHVRALEDMVSDLRFCLIGWAEMKRAYGGAVTRLGCISIGACRSERSAGVRLG